MALFSRHIIPTLAAVLLLLLPFTGRAQGYYFYDNGHYEPSWVVDLSGNAGVLFGVTDIGGNKKGNEGLAAYNLRSPRLGGGLSLTATHKDVVAIRLDFNAGSVEGIDSLLKGATHFSSRGRYDRNLSFRTNTFEFFAGVELHPLFLRDYQVNDQYMPRLSPYIMVGVGIVGFRPTANFNGTWVDLKPLRLEGQGFEEYPDRKEYSTTALTVPMAAGLRYEASRIITLRLELLHRFTTTDYLDDVSMGNWVDPALFYKYLPSGQAALATQLYNRSTVINPPRNTRPRGDNSRKDNFWSLQFRIGLALNRSRF